MQSNGDATPAWVRWLLIVVGATFIGLVVLGVVVFLWPWVAAFR